MKTTASIINVQGQPALRLTNVRLSFPSVFRPKGFEGQDSEPKFQATALFPKDGADDVLTVIREEIDRVGSVEFGEKWPVIRKSMAAENRLCLKDGDTKSYDGYADAWFIASSSTVRPAVVDRDGATPLVNEDARPYAGCYVNMVLRLWAQNNQWGKRINAELKAVQFVADGDRFGGGGPVDPTSVFDALDDADNPFSDDAANDASSAGKAAGADWE